MSIVAVCRRGVLAAILLVSGLAADVHAQGCPGVLTWTGQGVNTAWDNPDNWDGPAGMGCIPAPTKWS